MPNLRAVQAQMTLTISLYFNRGWRRQQSWVTKSQNRHEVVRTCWGWWVMERDVNGRCHQEGALQKRWGWRKEFWGKGRRPQAGQHVEVSLRKTPNLILNKTLIITPLVLFKHEKVWRFYSRVKAQSLEPIPADFCREAGFSLNKIYKQTTTHWTFMWLIQIINSIKHWQIFTLDSIQKAFK